MNAEELCETTKNEMYSELGIMSFAIFVVISILTREHIFVTSHEADTDGFLSGADSYNGTYPFQERGADYLSNIEEITDDNDDDIKEDDDDTYTDNLDYEAEPLSLSSLIADTICAICRESGNTDCIITYCARANRLPEH